LIDFFQELYRLKTLLTVISNVQLIDLIRSFKRVKQYESTQRKIVIKEQKIAILEITASHFRWVGIHCIL